LAWALPFDGIEENAIMFKVTTITNQRQRILALESSLVGPWLPSLKGTWDEERRAHEGATFVIDLTNVTIVRQHGENILFQMMTEGARLVAIAFSLELSFSKSNGDAT
jgi:hypothetical protein